MSSPQQGVDDDWSVLGVQDQVSAPGADPIFDQKRKELRRQQILRPEKRDDLFSKLVKVEGAIEKGEKLEIQQLNLLFYEGAAAKL